MHGVVVAAMMMREVDGCLEILLEGILSRTVHGGELGQVRTCLIAATTGIRFRNGPVGRDAPDVRMEESGHRMVHVPNDEGPSVTVRERADKLVSTVDGGEVLMESTTVAATDASVSFHVVTFLVVFHATIGTLTFHLSILVVVSSLLVVVSSFPSVVGIPSHH
jgi:hypothetical protein